MTVLFTHDPAGLNGPGAGDTVAALNLAGVSDDYTYVSPAGGAVLKWPEGKSLPGNATLEGSAEAA